MDSLHTLLQLRIASIVEGATLLILLGIAVPLKYAASFPAVVSVMGPVHGLSFLAYMWLAINVVSGEKWKKRDAARILIGAIVPFGGFFNASFIQERERLLKESFASSKVKHP